MTECWYEFPDSQEQADAISALKRGAEALGHRVVVYDAPTVGPGIKRVSVSGDFKDKDALTEDIRSMLYLELVRDSRRPSKHDLTPN